MQPGLQFVKPDVDKGFFCSVCGEVWDPADATQCAKCEETFCRLCRDEATAKNNVCLKCKDETTFTKVPRLIRSMAEALEVWCPYRGFGCTWTGVRTAVAAHTDAPCPHRPRKFCYVDESSIPDELKCPVCTDPLVDPAQLPCEHHFCRECILKCLARSSRCPVCQLEVEASAVGVPHKLVFRMLEQLEVRCPGQNCNWRGPRREVVAHAATCVSRTAIAKPIVPSEGTKDKKIQGSALLHKPQVAANELNAEIDAMIHLDAPQMIGVQERKRRLILSAAIDVSGSMSGSKLSMAKETLSFMVNELTEQDELSIVAFDTEVAVKLAQIKMDAQFGKPQALAAIQSLRALSSTNLSGGLFTAMKLIRGEKVGAQRGPEIRSLVDALTGVFSPPQPEEKPFIPALSFTIIHDYSPVVRDGSILHRYGVKVLPCSSAARYIQQVEVGGQHGIPRSQKGPSNADFAFEPVPNRVPEVEVRIIFRPQLDEPPFSVTKKLGDKEEETIQVQLPARGKVAPVTESAVSKCVMLFTDGVMNCGITDAEKLVLAVTSDIEAHERDLVLHTFGFGADHSADLLRQLSEAGQGMYYYVEGVDSMKGAFADCLGGLFSTVAEKIEVHILPCSGFKIDRVMSTFPVTSEGDGSRRLHMQDLYSTEQRDILFRLKTQEALPVNPSLKLFDFSVKYWNNLTEQGENISGNCTVCVSAIPFTGSPNLAVEQQLQRFFATEALQEARKRAEAGNVVEAKEVLQRWCVGAYASPSNESPLVQGVAREVAQLQGLMVDGSAYRRVGSKHMNAMLQRHAVQRGNTAGLQLGEEAHMYDNEIKKEMRKKTK